MFADSVNKLANTFFNLDDAVAQKTVSRDRPEEPLATSEQSPLIAFSEAGDQVTSPVSADLDSSLSIDEQAELAQRYAPILYFHPDEEHFLQDPNTFIEESSLRQERDFWPDKELYGQGDIPPEELAEIEKENENADSQIFLDHDDSKREGDLDNSKNLYQYDPETNTLTYFLFYSYNDGAPGRVGDVQNHEGDWERITVQLDDSYEPTEVRYAAHEGSNVSRSWSDAVTEDGRPVVYVAKGSHASLAEPGTRPTDFPGVNDVASDQGIRFDTSQQAAVDVTQEAYYGGYALWGERGSLSELGLNFTSGPTGPSVDKGPVEITEPPAETPTPPAGTTTTTPPTSSTNPEHDRPTTTVPPQDEERTSPGTTVPN